MQLSSSKPYLARAIYEWLVDNELTPHILVAANYPGTQVPSQFIEDGRIVLNISPRSVQGLHMGQDMIHFSARFSGVARNIEVPLAALLGIYARENGQGMFFDAEEPAPEPETPQPPAGAGKPGLRLVR